MTFLGFIPSMEYERAETSPFHLHKDCGIFFQLSWLLMSSSSGSHAMKIHNSYNQRCRSNKSHVEATNTNHSI
ncbi:hypothetical protein MTR_6g036577 [Medicago truncatula]|uniref:Uncharacterized protein n=1 Tax=Medicago truncatula TaxID=3880 RepID=A0A072U9Z4_MEDTR|nr:hypothetical protein MTR_6g036577 [Medicago truncatula]